MNDDPLIKHDLEELKKENVSLGRILKACFIDHNNNINSKITPRLFYDKLHVNTPQCDVLVNSLYSDINNVDNRMFFLTGFSGTGKSTFIHYFKKCNQINLEENIGEFNFRIIDFHKSAGEKIFGEDKILNQIKFYIKDLKLRENSLVEESYIRFINKIESMRRYFSDSLINHVEKNILKNSNKLDSFIFFY